MENLSESESRASSVGSTSSSTNDNKYDVFLSFRGKDTRYGFTDQLYNTCVEANMSTFMDDEEIDAGVPLKPELERAIRASRASIIVLSKDYATSTWCLDELALILEQPKHIVMPIFYHVEPTHVRKQESSFGDAMAKHKETMEEKTDAEERRRWAQKIDCWIQALDKVAGLKGVVVNGSIPRLERKFANDIVKVIYRRLRMPSWSGLPQLFGMDDSIEFVTSWLKDDCSDKGDVLTILGMGGIGKTSLAKYVYRSNFREFEASSFIKEIGRTCASKTDGLLYLQEQLCGDISNRSSDRLNDVSLYTSKIENVLAHRKVFLVLDDIDNLVQLEALLGSKELHPGSKIIITTNNTWLTKCSSFCKIMCKPEHAEYELEGLSETDSQKLLCFHAFASNNPEASYEGVLIKIVKYCHGHPLALRVLGKNLYDMDVAYWEECIEALSKESNSDINTVLRRNFDLLPSGDDKELFKHIACFFCGIDKDVAETILRACGIRATVGIVNLIGKCLLSVGRNNELVMHKLLQEMGRNVVHQESPKKPWKRSLLWRHEESFKVLKQKKGKENILGLALDMRILEKENPGASFHLTTDALSNMDSLMILELNYVQMSGSYENFPEELRWLCMHGFPEKSIPLELPMEYLVALDLSYSKIESFDISYTNPSLPQKRNKLNESCFKDKKLPGSLKILDLSFCEQLRRVGGFDELHALERLMLTNCINLLDVCKSVEQCVKLVLVDLSYCKTLRKLPRTIERLKYVKTLLVDGCNLGESPVGISDTESQKLLKVNNSGINRKRSSSVILESIPSDWKFFTTSLPRSLVSLSFENTNLSTESFPMDFSCLFMLKELYLDENPIVSLPNCVKNLPSLEILSMRNCNMLMTIENPPYKLAFLNLYSNSQHKPLLQKVVFVQKMSPLELSLGRKSLAPSSFEIEGMVKIQPIKNVEEKVLRGLGWSNLDFPDECRVRTDLLLRGPEDSEIQMYYEFGIFSTIYGGEKMPNWIRRRSKGPSISFIIPSSPNNFRGLNFCLVQTSPFRNNDFLNLPLIRISNITKKLTWIYEHYIRKASVSGKCAILLNHWMFGKKEMEGGDKVTITVTERQDKVTKECGVGFVYADGKTNEKDVLDYYKSWNHIIGGHLTGFQLTTGEYILHNERFLVHGTEVNLYYRPLVGDGASFEDEVWFRAFSKRKSDIFGDSHERGSMQVGSASKGRHSSTIHHRLPSVRPHRRPSQLARTRRHRLLHKLHWQTILCRTRMRIQKRRVQRRSRRPPGHHGRIHT